MPDFEEDAPRILTRERFRQCVIAGARRVIASRDLLNRINVFPVPDGDTGTNLAATMRAVAAGLREPLPSLDAVSATIALSALSGAQGSSGVILAEFFQGLREGIADSVHLTVDRFVAAIRHAATRARGALAQPREGTILTVMTDVADHLAACLDRLPDFRVLLDEGLRVARRSLAETQNRLAVLREAGVVDAGALGFVQFLEGIRDHVFQGAARIDEDEDAIADADAVPAPRTAVSPVAVDFRYCTEAVVDGKTIDRAVVQQALSRLGDSIVMAGTSDEIHAHVHSNAPALVFDALEEFGDVKRRKVDDMWEMVVAQAGPATRSGIALVTDSVCDLPMSVLTDNRIQVIPLRVSFGDETLLDRVDISPRRFYERIEIDPQFPTTSQPRPADFLATYRHLTCRFAGILSIHLSGEVSGTFGSALAAARQVSEETGVPIHVVDSRSASVGEALVVWAALHAVEAGNSLDGCARTARAAAEATDVYVFVPTIEYFVRGGRVSPLRGRIASLLRILPILTVRNGKVAEAGKAWGARAARRNVLRRVERRAASMRSPVFAVSHSAAPDLAQAYEAALRRRFPDAEILTADAAPALGSHAGPGGATIAVLDGAAIDRPARGG